MRSHLNGLITIYTLDQLNLMHKIDLKKRNESNEDYFNNLPEVIRIQFFPDHMKKVVEGKIDICCVDITYVKVIIHRRYGIENKDCEHFAFYILDDLVKGRLDNYGYLKARDNIILEMLKKYKYIEE